MEFLAAFLEAMAGVLNPDIWTVQPYILPQSSLEQFWYAAILLASVFCTAASYFIMYAS